MTIISLASSTDIGIRKGRRFERLDHAERVYTYFPSMLAAFVWSVVDPAVVEHLGDEEFALGGAGTGPWQFSDFGPLDATGHEAESNYLGGNSPSLSELTWLFLTRAGCRQHRAGYVQAG